MNAVSFHSHIRIRVIGVKCTEHTKHRSSISTWTSLHRCNGVTIVLPATYSVNVSVKEKSKFRIRE